MINFLIHFEFLGSCTCKDLLSSSGSGNCLARSGRFDDNVFCYVEQPTTCDDALHDNDLPGEMMSAQACTKRKFALRSTKNNVRTIQVKLYKFTFLWSKHCY